MCMWKAVCVAHQKARPAATVTYIGPSPSRRKRDLLVVTAHYRDLAHLSVHQHR